MSARYSILDKEFYLPWPENLARQSKKNRQGRTEVLEGDEAQAVLDLLKRDAASAYDGYEKLTNDHDLARELSRMNLPVSIYTQWYWKIDLKNLLHFLSLRMDPHAQYEIRAYANVIGDVVKEWVPFSWEAFNDYHPYRGAVTFSLPEQHFIQLARSCSVFIPDMSPMKDDEGKMWKKAAQECGLSTRELTDLEKKLPMLGLERSVTPTLFATVNEDTITRSLAKLRTKWEDAA